MDLQEKTKEIEMKSGLRGLQEKVFAIKDNMLDDHILQMPIYDQIDKQTRIQNIYEMHISEYSKLHSRVCEQRHLENQILIQKNYSL